jgi:hypothetical protein
MKQGHDLWQDQAGLESMVSLPAAQVAACRTNGACMHDTSANRYLIWTTCLHRYTHKTYSWERKVSNHVLQHSLCYGDINYSTDCEICHFYATIYYHHNKILLLTLF